MSKNHFKTLPTTPFGIHAMEPQLNTLQDDLPDQPPINQKGTSFLTYNQYGYSDFESNVGPDNWLMEALLGFSKQAQGPILDVGGGYGSLAKTMLAQGATVILNDMGERHLLLARKIIPASSYPKLYLTLGKFPGDLDFPDNSLSAVILFRVLLFCAPAEIEAGLAKIYRWLAPGGKIFISTLPPQRGEYKDKVLPIYESQWESGNPWPGYAFKSADILGKEQDHFPEDIHLMDEKPLEQVFSKVGFAIEQAGLIESNRGGKSGKELLGLIAWKL